MSSCGSVFGVHGVRPRAVLLTPALSVALSPCPSAIPENVGQPCSAWAALPLAWAVKCCPEVPPERIRLSHIRSGSLAPAPVLQEPAESESNVRASSLPTPRGPSAISHRPSPSWLVRIHQRRRRPRKPKRSMWREIWPEARRRSPCGVLRRPLGAQPEQPSAACCCCAPALLSGFADLDELSVALSCRFAFDIWTLMQQDCPSADQESSVCSDSLVLVSLDALCELVRPSTPGADVHERLRAQFLQSRGTAALNGEH